VGGSVFVLFVEDDVAFADEAARSLETIGMRTVVALGSLAALDAFDANAIDVVVTDIKLPAREDHALALARMINKRRPRVPFILMTTYPKLPEGEVARLGGVLCNPLELAELCREIAARQT
jgi:DNA-binding NtrC family response regulator